MAEKQRLLLSKYFPTLQLKPCDSPLCREERPFLHELLNPLIQPSLNAGHIDLHVLLTEPTSLSTSKDQQLKCKIPFCTSVYV